MNDKNDYNENNYKNKYYKKNYYYNIDKNNIDKKSIKITKKEIRDYIEEIVLKYDFDSYLIGEKILENNIISKIKNITENFKVLFEEFYNNELSDYELLLFFLLLKQDDLITLSYYDWMSKRLIDQTIKDVENNVINYESNFIFLPLNNIKYLENKSYLEKEEFGVASFEEEDNKYNKKIVSDNEINKYIIKIRENKFILKLSFLRDKEVDLLFLFEKIFNNEKRLIVSINYINEIDESIFSKHISESIPEHLTLKKKDFFININNEYKIVVFQ